jgi:hypothetical protein
MQCGSRLDPGLRVRTMVQRPSPLPLTTRTTRAANLDHRWQSVRAPATAPPPSDAASTATSGTAPAGTASAGSAPNNPVRHGPRTTQPGTALTTQPGTAPNDPTRRGPDRRGPDRRRRHAGYDPARVRSRKKLVVIGTTFFLDLLNQRQQRRRRLGAPVRPLTAKPLIVCSGSARFQPRGMIMCARSARHTVPGIGELHTIKQTRPAGTDRLQTITGHAARPGALAPQRQLAGPPADSTR